MKQSKNGSTWRKWDLHFHTPSSYDYKDKGVTNEQIIEVLHANNVEVVAITDHHKIDVERIKDLQSLGKGKVTVLPGIEFRAELGGSESIHFIGLFSEESDINDISIKIQGACEISEKDIRDKGGDQNIYCDFKKTCRLIHELGGLVTVHAGAKSNSIENITNSLDYKMALKKELVINHIDILELGKPEDQSVYEGRVFPVIDEVLPMIICTDNHNIKDYRVKENLWIKADPTFEGLKQVLYEPKHRVFIGKEAPVNPPICIENIHFKFPENSKLENEIFCLSGEKQLLLSPNYTCIIGGRGSGKSTILNLIHESLKHGQNKFFKTKRVSDKEGNPLSVDQHVIIENNIDENQVEFLAQNEIEDYAEDYDKLTDAVYNRILKRDEDGLIANIEESLTLDLEMFEENIQKGNHIATLKEELVQHKKDLTQKQKIIDSFTSKEYIEITKQIKASTEELTKLKTDKESLKNFLTDLKKVCDKHKIEYQNTNYSKSLNQLITRSEDIIKDGNLLTFYDEENRVLTLQDEILKLKKDLKKYLSDKGLTEENQKDITNANTSISSIKITISNLEKKIKILEEEYASFGLQSITNKSETYIENLNKEVDSISDFLKKIKSNSVKTISLSFEFNYVNANQDILEAFKLQFKEELSQVNYREGALQDLLFCILPKDVDTKDQLLESIKAYQTSSNAKETLTQILEDDRSFETYKNIIQLSLLNYPKYKIVKVLYDDRSIENSSFGQRCTAILIILLLLGNTPIIIDEPEAHLDSLLISDYLVDVIKERKKGRQIIFASHNANFVINGDAELIHILEMDEKSKTTKITSTTIENQETKEALVALEGGLEALKKRELKYRS